MGYYI